MRTPIPLINWLLHGGMHKSVGVLLLKKPLHISHKVNQHYLQFIFSKVLEKKSLV